MVINVFAPRNGAEFRRILRADGTLVVVVPTDRHLVELVDTLGLLKVDERKDSRVHDQLDPYFTRAKIATCEYSMTLDRADIAALVAMGPSAWHTDPAHIQETLQALPEPVPVTASATVTGYRPR